MRSSRTAGPLRWWSGGHQLGARHPPAPFGDYFWDPGRDQLGACLFDDLDLEAVVAGSGRTWIVLAVPDACWSTERVIETIDRTGRTVTRTDLDGPSTLLLVE